MRQSRYLRAEILNGETLDPFLEGKIKVIQSKRGYRFSVDVLLLARFVTVKRKEIVVDLGTGCGIIPLIINSEKVRPAYTIGVEIQWDLAYQAMRNMWINGFEDSTGIVQADLRHIPLKSHFAHCIICNPPYRRAKSGRINPELQKAIARHEIMVSLEDIIKVAGYLLRPKGRIAMIYRADRLIDMIYMMRRYSFEPKRLQLIYSDPQRECKLFLIESVYMGRPQLTILPPILNSE